MSKVSSAYKRWRYGRRWIKNEGMVLKISEVLIFCAFSSYKLSKHFYHKMNWFESPFPKASRQNHFISDTSHDPEDNWGNVLNLHSPPDNLNFPSHPHPLSPWSRSLTDPPLTLTLSLPSLPNSNITGPLNFSDEEEELMTPVRQHPGSKEEGDQHTTGRKSEGDLLFSGKRSRPREKGLRKLSQRAYEIVQEMRNVTYKEVAAKLVQQLNEDQLDSENKEEQNIKRRVYDALNVLIALGVLRKDGRKIVSNRLRQGKLDNAKRVEGLKQKLISKELALKEKREKLKEETIKRDNIIVLVKRNQKCQKDSLEIIPFPFIGVNCRTSIVERKEGSIKVENFLIEMKANQALLPFGDMDTLRFFNAEQAEDVLLTSKQDSGKDIKCVDKGQLLRTQQQGPAEDNQQF